MVNKYRFKFWHYVMVLYLLYHMWIGISYFCIQLNYFMTGHYVFNNGSEVTDFSTLNMGIQVMGSVAMLALGMMSLYFMLTRDKKARRMFIYTALAGLVTSTAVSFMSDTMSYGAVKESIGMGSNLFLGGIIFMLYVWQSKTFREVFSLNYREMSYEEKDELSNRSDKWRNLYIGFMLAIIVMMFLPIGGTLIGSAQNLVSDEERLEIHEQMISGNSYTDEMFENSYLGLSFNIPEGIVVVDSDDLNQPFQREEDPDSSAVLFYGLLSETEDMMIFEEYLPQQVNLANNYKEILGINSDSIQIVKQMTEGQINGVDTVRVGLQLPEPATAYVEMFLLHIEDTLVNVQLVSHEEVDNPLYQEMIDNLVIQ